MTDRLEQRYARLLNVYPADYRRARGAEVLATLLESAGAQGGRPTLRETAALVLGALRVRAGGAGRRTVGQTWLSAIRVAVLMLLVYDSAHTALRTALTVPGNVQGHGILGLANPDTIDLVALALGTYAIVAVVRHRYRRAIVATATAFALVQAVQFPSVGLNSSEFWQAPLAIVLLAPLVRRPPARVSGSLSYLLAVPVGFAALELYASRVGPGAFGWQIGVLVAVSLAGLGWAAVDERVALALGVLLLNGVLNQIVFATQMRRLSHISTAEIVVSVGLAAVAPALLLAVGATVARRQARI